MAAELAARPAASLQASSDLELPHVNPRALACALGPDHSARLLILTHDRQLRGLIIADGRLVEDFPLLADCRENKPGLAIGTDGTAVAWAGERSWRANPGTAWTQLPTLEGLLRVIPAGKHILALSRTKGAEANSRRRFNLFVIGGPGAAAPIPWWDRPAKLSIHRLNDREWSPAALVNRDDRLGFEQVLASQCGPGGDLQVLFESNHAFILGAPANALQLLKVPLDRLLTGPAIALEAPSVPLTLPSHWASGRPLGDPKLSASATVDLCMARSDATTLIPASDTVLQVKTLPNFPARLCAWEPGPENKPLLCPLLVDTMPVNVPVDLIPIDRDHAALLLRLGPREFLGETRAGLALILRQGPGLWTRPLRLVSTPFPETALLACAPDRFLLVWLDDQKILRTRWLFVQ